MKRINKIFLLVLVMLFVISLSACDNKVDVKTEDKTGDKVDGEGDDGEGAGDDTGEGDPSDGDGGQVGDDTEEQDGIYNVSIFDKEADIDWSKVKNANIETYKWVESDKFNSFGQLVFVNGYGFICKLSCEELNPYVQYHNDGDPVYKDSAMEFFVSLSSELGYINLETNSVGARLQQYSLSLTQRVSVFDTIESGIMVTPDRSGDYWTLTIRLTLEDINKLYPEFDTEVFKTGYEFSGNFYKIGTNPTTGLRHYGMWKEVGGTSPNFHQPNDFGKFVLN